ncbi:MAG: di-trans,poly-cis-decaprenylcistransferase [Candidatus Diapherotrites archaeon]|jgi:tritrans,polycis-undecaprenyl-diphosphate synthase [geranylgeranyl-diphosphate specific]|nr:di-trans,poly-cis-decaprenylcistransferase [Candidatus Diapherotrites archaeon]
MINSIAFIPDGNRRYAKDAKISLLESYSIGTNKAWDILEWLTKYPTIKVGTFYTFSLKNFQRSKLELAVLMKIFDKELTKVKDKEILKKEGIALKFIGRREQFPKKLQTKMKEAEKLTSNYGDRTVNLALGYDGQTEIIDAAQKFATDVQKGKALPETLSTDSFRKYLYSDFAEPDLIIRTSSEKRLSGFLTYQSAYSEFAFINKYWPQITEADVDKLVNDYNKRNRRFGK